MKLTIRKVLLGFGLCLCVTGPGCSRLKSFRSSDGPVIGSAVAPRTGAKPGQQGDLYAEQFHSKTRPETMIAQANPVRAVRPEAEPDVQPQPVAEERVADLPRSESEDEQSKPVQRVSVALQPPVPIPASNLSVPRAAANRRDPAWKPGSETDSVAPAPASMPAAVAARSAPRPQERPAGPTLESLLAETRAKLATLSTYQVQINRQERVGGSLLPAEDVLLSIRRDPKAVRLEWPSGPHKGREVLYSASENGGLMHVNMADSIVPVPRLSIAPDSPMILRSSRHPITEAGFDTIVRNIEKSLALMDAGDPSGGAVRYEGLQQPQPLDAPCHKIVRVTPSREIWTVYLDPRTKLPAMVQADSAQGELLERYVFRSPRLNVAELASKDAFDPNKRWGESGGLLQRLARASGRDSKGSADSSTH